MGTTARGGRRTAVIAGAAVVVAGVLGAGTYAATSVLGGGESAESALPGNALASLSVDLDPGASQKVAAVRTLRKLPSLRKELGADVDLREKLYDALLGDEDCSVSYDDDVAPWIGKKAAIAAVPFGSRAEDVAPVVALAVDDEDAARTGLARLADCGDAKGSAFVVSDGFALLGDSPEHVRAAARRAEGAPLADDASYRRWSERAGDRGIANFYVAPQAGDLLADSLDDLGGSGGGLGRVEDSDGSVGATLTAPALARSEDSAPQAQLKRSLASFSGAAGALRFADGGVELSAVGGGLGQGGAGRVEDLLDSMPADTAALLGFAVPGDLAERVTAQVDDLGGLFGLDTKSLERSSGLDLPEDLRTLLGSGVGVALRDADVDLDSVSGPADVPAGIVVRGDADRIEDAVDGVVAAQGLSLDDLGLRLEKGDGEVAASFDADWAAALASGDGGLVGSEKFRSVVPEAEKSSAVLYLDLDSAWREAVARAAGGDEKEVLADTEPLDAAGLSTWSEDGVSHLLLKVTTD